MASISTRASGGISASGIGTRSPTVMPARHDGVVLHVAHRDEPVDGAHAQPVQHVRHQLLEAHVLHAGHALGAGEVLLGAVAARLALARVVDEELRHLAQRASLLAEVDDEARAAGLGAADALLDGVGQVRAAGADVGAEDVRAVALVVHARGQRHGGIGELAPRRRTRRRSGRRWAAGTPPGRRASPARGTSARSARTACGAARPPCSRSACATPGRYHTGSSATLVTTAAPESRRMTPSGRRRPASMAPPDLGHVDVGLGDGDGRADVVALGQVLARRPRPPRRRTDRARRCAPARTTAGAGRCGRSARCR